MSANILWKRFWRYQKCGRTKLADLTLLEITTLSDHGNRIRHVIDVADPIQHPNTWIELRHHF